MKKIYPAEITNDSEDIFSSPAECKVMEDVDLIYFGRHSCPVILQENTNGKMLISENVANALRFTETKQPLHLFIDKKSIHIGPLVGIFSSRFTESRHKPIGERSDFFAKLLSLDTETCCIPFLFGEEHIDWDNETIQGLVFHNHRWNKREFPFPDVVYDRLPNRKTENQSGPIEVKRKFQEQYTIPWYNPGFFNKWDVYERLSEDDKAKPLLPETYPLSSFSSIEHLLSRYRQVFIKPIHGSLGLGIHQLLYDKHEHAYYCRYKNQDNQNKLQRFSSLEVLMNTVFRNRTLENLIIQQGIALIRFEKRPVDFRVHTNKNNQGIWQVTAIAAKVAGAGSVTTHIKNGGVVKTLQELFQNEQTAFEVKQKLEAAAITLSHAIEQHLDGIIAEIGFDLGVDKQGKVWMFEANSKPGRTIFSHPMLKEFEKLTRKLSLDYAVYLAEQSITHSIGVHE